MKGTPPPVQAALPSSRQWITEEELTVGDVRSTPGSPPKTTLPPPDEHHFDEKRAEMLMKGAPDAMETRKSE